MCWCTPNRRTPFCGAPGCVPPPQTHDNLPIIPGLPEPAPQPADGAIAQCGVCGLRIMPVMNYVCTNPRCGVFPRVTCST